MKNVKIRKDKVTYTKNKSFTCATKIKNKIR